MILVMGVVVGAVAFLIVMSNPQSEVIVTDNTKLIRDNRYGTGSVTAKVTLVEFGDYQCPACAAANPTVIEIIKAYKDNPNFNFVHRNFPLAQHGNAMIAAEAAEAAGAQGKFWEMHDLLYEKQRDWQGSDKPLDIFAGYAGQLGLDVNKFRQEVESDKYEDLIRTDARDGNSVGVSSTPTFYLNGKQSVGVPLLEGLKQKIDEELAR